MQTSAPHTAPYGTWPSPLTAADIVAAGVGLSQPRFTGPHIYWLESRPTEGGRNVVVRRGPDGRCEDVNAAPLNARTRVHEYGGGDYLVLDDGSVLLSDFADQRLHRVGGQGAAQAVTAHEGDAALRYADAVQDPQRARVLCVREDHRGGGEPLNTLVAITLADGVQTVLHAGRDFYAAPRLSPDGCQLAWLAWDHPHMPWDAAELWLAEADAEGRLPSPRRIAGGDGVAIVQPEWSPDGRLHYLSDATGWWNLYRHSDEAAAPLVALEAEFGRPAWQFGGSSYAFDGPGRIVCSYLRGGMAQLALVDTASGTLRDLDTPFNTIGHLRAAGGCALFMAASAHDAGGLYLMDLASAHLELLRAASSLKLDAGFVSAAQAITFATPSVPGEPSAVAHGFFYPPQNADCAAPPGDKPPLLVMSHGGPTSMAAPALSARIQFWTSRGIAVLDVNYGGSSGYGRAYRQRLAGRWGVVDVLDCIAGAQHLVQQGRVDGARLAITGGSAGGYTTLAALAFHDVFRAGASHYGIGDLEALARDTHKFESRYLDQLVGPYPAQAALYRERSPIHHTQGLSCPVIFFQGLEDRVVPPNQAEAMVQALRVKGVPVAYLPFAGEQHGFRQAHNMRRALEAELVFYGRVFGFTPAGDLEPVPIDNLPG